MIRLVIFDVDGVLVHYDRRRRMEVMAHCLGRSVDEVTAAVFDSGAEDRADAGQTNADEYLRELGEHLGAPVTRDLRLAKPDPKVFHAVVGHYGVAPADTLFVDDSADYVDGARRAGLRTQVFDGYEALVARLGDEGVTTE